MAKSAGRKSNQAVATVADRSAKVLTDGSANVTEHDTRESASHRLSKAKMLPGGVSDRHPEQWDYYVTAVARATKETDMDTTKKVVVVEPPKSTAPPVKAQPQPEHKTQHDAAKPGGNQPNRKP
jgi:hypothetical protein